MNTIIRGSILAGLLIVSTATASIAQTLSGAIAQKRIEQMAGIARLWGAVKFFHPALAERDIDWDAALVEALRDLDVEASDQAYSGLVSRMLRHLDDPATTVGESGATALPLPPAGSRYDPASHASFGSRDGVLIIDGAAITDYWARESFDSAAANRRQMQRGIDSARAVVLDLRFDMERTGARDPDQRQWHLGRMLSARLPMLFGGTIQLGTTRVRMHSGYPPDAGSTSGGYQSGLMTIAGGSIVGMRDAARALPLVVIVDSTTPDVTETLMALRQSGARIVLEGRPATGENSLGYSMTLPGNFPVRIRIASALHGDGSSGLSADTILPTPRSAERHAAIDAAVSIAGRPVQRTSGAAIATPVIDPVERAYDTSAYPSRELRLLALVRYWNVIHYFFPYRDLIGEPWENVLTRFIPEFERAGDSLEYSVAVAHLTAAIHDMHGYVDSPVLRKHIGMASPDLAVRAVEGRTIVVMAGESARAAGVMPGDEIRTIDGRSVDERIAFLTPLISAATPQALRYLIDTRLLHGPEGTAVSLGIAGRDGRMRAVSLPRTGSSPPYARTTPVYRMLPGGIGYADLDRLGIEDVAPMFDSLQSAGTIIFDMRGYPKGTAWPITARLTDTTLVVAKFSRPQMSGIDLAGSMWSGSPSFSFDQLISPEGKRYRGKIVVLINAEAGSQSEHTCLFLEAAADATFIGSPTMGSNGDVTNVILPGGILCSFSGHDVRHADGRQLQRIGILPHIAVEPTVRGIREGRDEVLEAAVRFVRSGGKRSGRSGTSGKSDVYE